MGAEEKRLREALAAADKAAETAETEAERAEAAKDAAQLAQMLLDMRPKESKKPKGTPLSGAAEVAATIGTGVVAEPVSGWAGIGAAMMGQDPTNAIRSTQEQLTYAPRTETGGRYLNAFASAMDTPIPYIGPRGEPMSIAETAERTMNFFAERGADLMAPLGLDAEGYAAGKAVLPAASLTAGTKLLKPKAATPRPRKVDPRIERVRRGDVDTAGLKVKKGRVRRDSIEKMAQRQGVDDGVITTVRVASPKDKAQMREMLKIVERGQRDARYRATTYPNKVVGDSIAKRYKHIAAVNKRAGQAIDDAARRLKGQAVDYGNAVDTYLQRLDDLGITFNQRTGKLSFRNSDIQDLSGLENILKRVNRRMLNVDAPDAYSVHQLKRYLDRNISYGKKLEGLDGKVERVLRQLREDLDNALDSTFPEYNKVNTIYSETKRALDGFQDAVSKKIDFDGPNVDRALGVESRKLLSNYASGTQQLDALDDLTAIANKYGGAFDDDLVAQVMFYNELNRLFPNSFRTTFQGDIEKAVGNAARRGPVEAAKDYAIDKAADVALGRNEQNLLKSLRQLLSEQLPE